LRFPCHFSTSVHLHWYRSYNRPSWLRPRICLHFQPVLDLFSVSCIRSLLISLFLSFSSLIFSHKGNNQFKVKIPLPTRSKYGSLDGKVAIITGANTGLGLESAKQLLTLGLSHLIVAVRSIEKGKAAASQLKLANPKATIDVWDLDMESYASIQSFAERCKTLPHIDYTILNAGLGPLKFSTTKATGHEKAIQVNFLSTVLLTILLLPILKAKGTRDKPARLTIINSVTAHLCKFPNRDQRPLIPSFDDVKITPW
jgi:hypothetical protein